MKRKEIYIYTFPSNFIKGAEDPLILKIQRMSMKRAPSAHA